MTNENSKEMIDDNSNLCLDSNNKIDEVENKNFTSSDTSNNSTKVKWTGVQITVFVFMIFGCLLSASTIFTFSNTGFKLTIPLTLIWQIPMTVTYYKHIKNRQKHSTCFKVCSLLFVNIIAGIIMLIDEDN